jgi:hypothetical protein
VEGDAINTRIGAVSGGHRRSRPQWLAVLAAFVVTGLSGCSSPSIPAAQPNATPLSTLHHAINAVLKAPDFSLVMTLSPGAPGAAKPVYRVVIDRPDRISISGGTNVIAIGSTGYFKVQPGWTVVHHVGESANFTNDMLMYVNILNRTTSIVRRGESYTVPSDEATTLLVSTGLPRFQNPVGVSFTASVGHGQLKSVSLAFGGTSPMSATTTIGSVGTSRHVSAPARNQIVPG